MEYEERLWNWLSKNSPKNARKIYDYVMRSKKNYCCIGKLKEDRELLLKEILSEVDAKKTTEDGDYIEKQQYHFYNLALSEVKELICKKII